MRAILLFFALLMSVTTLDAASARPRHRASPAPVAQVADDDPFAALFGAPAPAPRAEKPKDSGGDRFAQADPWPSYPGRHYVVTREMMDRYNVRSVCDAMRLVPGVQVNGCWW